MTPKEKANDLCKKAAKILGYFEYDLSEEVKDVALLCVDEVTSALNPLTLEYEYWEEVEQEIEKL